MNINDIYKDKELIIRDLMQDYVLSPLFDNIDEDDKYDFSTVENIELCLQLMKMWVDKETSTNGFKHDEECNGYHTTCEKCADDELKICCNSFGASEYCKKHNEEE